MQNHTLETARTSEGALDIRHYARKAAAERREAKINAMRSLGQLSKKGFLAVAAIFTFWNIPPMGGGSSKEMPYR